MIVGMQTSSHTSHKFASILVWAVLAVASVGTWIVVSGLNESSSEYVAAQNELRKSVYGGSVAEVQLPDSDKKINIPTWSLFQPGNIWALISKTNPLPDTFTPEDLVESPIAHGDSSEKMQVSSHIVTPLKNLVEAANKDGHTLVLSSAYRSISDQQQLMKEFIAVQGEAVAKTYVAEPGSSEHHTGLSVDFADASPACSLDSDDCNLSSDSAEWLADNAYKYGFIQRYPEGTKSITGIAYEPWHYRYVGVALARAMHDSSLTFDEFVELAR